MAITPLTGFKAFEFDGEVSTDYGVQILGEGVFNAPEREVEMINIPGRNGAFALDKGRFENIEVVYPANIIANSTADFAAAVSDLRNMLCSRRGYCRLTDDYHPDEYRMAVYKSGLEVDEKVLRAGEFEIVFDCKPQRYLASGEEAVSVSDGDTITNPTRFDSSPMLEVEGYGTITLNGYEIELENVVLGEIETSDKTRESTTVPNGAMSLQSIIDYSSKINTIQVGDSLFISALKVHDEEVFFSATGASPTPTKSAVGIDEDSITATASVRNTSGLISTCTFALDVLIENIELTAFTDETGTATITMPVKNTSDATLATYTVVVTVTNTANGVLTIEVNSTYTNGTSTPMSRDMSAEFGRTYLYSTVSALGNPTYIDCELGAAYLINSGTPISLNQHIDLGSMLPVLSPGSNTISFDDTVTELDVIPRWWKI